MTTPFQRKPPKNADQIRSSLESIHRTAGVKTESGPLSDGFGSDYQITVGSFFDPDVALDFQQTLSQAGVFSSLVSERQQTRVLVDDEDRQRANELFQVHRKQHANRRPYGNSRRFDFLIFGIGMALTVSFVLIVGEWDHPLALTIPLTLGAIGASVGHVMDRLRIRHWRTGRWGMGVWEFLVLATVPALIAVASKLLPQILYQ